MSGPDLAQTGAPAAGPPRRRRRHQGDERLIEGLLLGLNQQQAGERAGVSRRTVTRRIADPGFQRRLAEAQAEAEKQVRRRITASAVAGLQKLAAILADPSRTDEHERVARTMLQAFVQLQPKELRQDIEVHDAPVIDYRIIGIDAELLR